MSDTSAGGVPMVSQGAFVTREQVLSCQSLPTLPSVAMELLEKTSNPDVALGEIAALIQSDPGLSSRVLKTVNSSFYGLSKPCPSIDRAIAMLGLRAVKSLVLGFSMVNLTQGATEALDLEKFWRHTILAAAGARQIATVTGEGEPDEAFAAGLFQDMGVLAMLAAAPEPYGELLVKVGISHHDLGPLENEHLGFGHAAIGAELAERWKMPEMIVAAIGSHHHPPAADEHLSMIRTVALGTLAAQVVCAAFPGPAMDDLMGNARAWFGLDHDRVMQLIEAITQSSKEIAKLLGQKIGEMPDPQELLAAANQRLVESQIEVQREAATFQKQAQAFEQAATTDGLTGVPNRKRFDELVEQAEREAKANHTPYAVLFSDADKFKLVNDNYGHHAGDIVLQELAKRLTQTIGDRGTVCRYGGEEFAMILPGMDLLQAAAVGEEARRCIESPVFDLRHVPEAPDSLPRTVSVGVAAWRPGDDPALSGQELVQRADKAVYLAKESGRNNVKRWGVDLNDPEPMADGPVTAPPASAAAAAPAPQAALTPPPPATQAKALPPGVPDLSLPGAAAPAHSGPATMLLIEDDPLASRLLEAMFQRAGDARITTMPNGREAIEYLRDAQRPGKRLPDMIICDLNVPGFTGVQIIRALKAHQLYCQIPIVVITASAEDEQWAACRSAGVSQIYSKMDICADMKGWCQRMVGSVRSAA